MPPLSCPLCCGETFSTHSSLKYHILSTVDNLLCPSCNKRCYSFLELIDHLDSCEDKRKCIGEIKQEIDSEAETEGAEDNPQLLFVGVKTEVDNEQTNGNCKTKALEHTDNPMEQENLMYSCQICAVSFNSIEEHLANFHEGEEVLLETDGELPSNIVNDEGGSTDENEPFYVCEEYTENAKATVDKNANPNDGDNNETMENNGVAEEPFTEKYSFLNGTLKKITEEEVASIEDKTKIIEIHSCPKCSLKFPNIGHYNKHKCTTPKSVRDRPKTRNSKLETKYKCTFCQVVYSSLIALNDHMKSHLVEDKSGRVVKRTVTLAPHVCEVCQTRFPSFKSLRLHKRMHEPLKSKELDEGANEGSTQEQFDCPVCQRTYDREYEEDHMKSHEYPQDFLCGVCNRKFCSKSYLELHMKAHSNVKKFVCSYCKKGFNNCDALQDHVTNQCTQRHYECQYCGRRFTRPHEKVKHERIHTGEKPHVCQICGKAFRVTYCLTLHMRTHSRKRPYECKQCDKKFKWYSVYNHHMMTHSEDRKYKCPFCPKAFKTSVQLAGHKNSHTKPFTCTECNRPFASLYAVKAHMETHKRQNNLKYGCWYCGASYARSFALKDHMRIEHAEYTDTEKNEEFVETNSRTEDQPIEEMEQHNASEEYVEDVEMVEQENQDEQTYVVENMENEMVADQNQVETAV